MSSLACTVTGRSICATSPTILDGPEEPSQYVFFGNGVATSPSPQPSPSGRGGNSASALADSGAPHSLPTGDNGSLSLRERAGVRGNRAPELSRAGGFIEEPAVTLTIAKRPGANAIFVAHEVMKKVDTLKGRVIPNGVQVTITRNYGQTAEEKSDELLLHMGIAVDRRVAAHPADARLARVAHRGHRHSRARWG